MDSVPEKPGDPAPACPLVRVESLVKHFPIRAGLFRKAKGIVHAVDGISFNVIKGRTLGLVGESGCGKTTAGRTILRLLDPTAGRVWMDGLDIFSLSAKEMRAARARMQLIFQDPFGSLDPRMTVGAIVGEGLVIHGRAKGAELEARVAEVLRRVGLAPEHARRYPHEFSGGQRQRVGIARAVALNPEFIVCDEPVSALDVSVQAQVINLLADLQAERGISYLFISHDLSVVRHICADVAVMYLGQIVELSPSPALFAGPRHPYTRALLSAVPTVDPATRRTRIVLEGDPPSPADPPAGCRFHPRCPAARGDASLMARCRSEPPPLYDLGEAACRCFLVEKDAGSQRQGSG
jgi:oligopeptide/dipeptide ABC transporter ATP-binding protein